MTRDLDAAIERIADERGWRRLRSASALLDAWRAFVVECGSGYPMSIYEFENDRSVRGMVDGVLSDRCAKATTRYAEFSREIHAEDTRYRALLQPDVHAGGSGDPWWQRGVLRYARAELVADFADLHGIEIEIRDGTPTSA